MPRPLLSIAALVALGLTLAIPMIGCGDAKDSATTPPPVTSLPASTQSRPAPTGPGEPAERIGWWVAVKVQGRELVEGTELRLGLGARALSAAAGCNEMGARYRIEGDRLRLQGDSSTTMMACGGKVMAQERWFTSFLRARPRVELAGDTLRLVGEDVAVTFDRASGRPGSPPVAGTRWALVQTAAAGAAPVDVPAGVPTPTLHLAGGEAAIFTGCNRGSATGRLNADGFLELGRIATTRRGCTGEAAPIERQVLAVLTGRSAAGLDGDRLTLTQDGARLIFAVQDPETPAP